MIKIAWYDIQTDTDCISPTEWNNMVTYIQHSACTDFTIYAGCPSTGQAFKFTINDAGTISTMFGGGTSGDDLYIVPNDADARATLPYIALLNGDVFLNLTNASEFTIWEGESAQVLSVRLNVDNTTSEIYGGGDAGDTLKIFANSTDARPAISMLDNDIQIDAPTSGDIMLMDAGTPRIMLDGGNNNACINGTGLSNNYDLALMGQGQLALKETTTPTPDGSYGKIYCKADDKLYFQDGAGAEHEVAFV